MILKPYLILSNLGIQVMKLNEISEIDSEDLRVRKLQFKVGKNLVSQIQKALSAVKDIIKESDKLEKMIKRDIGRGDQDPDLFDFLFDLEHARNDKEKMRALESMIRFIKKGDFEVQ